MKLLTFIIWNLMPQYWPIFFQKQIKIWSSNKKKGLFSNNYMYPNTKSLYLTNITNFRLCTHESYNWNFQENYILVKLYFNFTNSYGLERIQTLSWRNFWEPTSALSVMGRPSNQRHSVILANFPHPLHTEEYTW